MGLGRARCIHPSPPHPDSFSTPSILNFANLSLDGVARQYLQLAVCLQNLFYYFDTFLQTLTGSPLGVPCQYPSPISPTGIGYRISLMCTLGNMVRTFIDGACSTCPLQT